MITAGKQNLANPRPPRRWSPEHLRVLACMVVLAGCNTFPQVPITTPKPLEVNLNMRLDIYQYRADEPTDKEATKGITEATLRMRNRMAEIQGLKNSQLVGEDHRGMLIIREVPAGDWGPQMKKAVTAENEDRMLIMRQKAKDTNRALHEIEAEQWRLRTQQANTGEWIEVPGSSPGSFEWKRAGTAEATPPPVTPATTTTPPPPPTTTPPSKPAP